MQRLFVEAGTELPAKESYQSKMEKEVKKLRMRKPKAELDEGDFLLQEDKI